MRAVGAMGETDVREARVRRLVTNLTVHVETIT